jgi:hypothetical protein
MLLVSSDHEAFGRQANILHMRPSEMLGPLSRC